MGNETGRPLRVETIGRSRGDALAILMKQGWRLGIGDRGSWVGGRGSGLFESVLSIRDPRPTIHDQGIGGCRRGVSWVRFSGRDSWRAGGKARQTLPSSSK